MGYTIWLPWLQTAKETVVTIGVMGEFLQTSVCIIYYVICIMDDLWYYGMSWSGFKIGVHDQQYSQLYEVLTLSHKSVYRLKREVQPTTYTKYLLLSQF